MESIKNLETSISMWIAGINKAIEDKHQILFSTSKSDYNIIGIDVEKMKISVIRKKDNNPGSLNVTSYDFEKIYKKLPKKYRKDVNVSEKKMKNEKVKKNVVKNKTDKRTKKSVAVDLIKSNPGITIKKICEVIKKEKLSSITDEKKLITNMKLNIKNITTENIKLKDNGYYI